MKIYITRGDQRAGPYNLAQINAFLNIGRLNLEDYAWYEGCLGWIRVKSVPGVKVISSPAEQASSTTDHQKAVVSRTKSVAPTSTLTSRHVKSAAQRIRIPCRICESGELVKTILPRFSRSLNALGAMLLVMGVLCMIAISFSLVPLDPPHHDPSPITITVSGGAPISLDLSQIKSHTITLQKEIVANWQFLFLSSFAGFILFFLFQTKKLVLQCNHCESVVAIE